jgi:hypothetical protein
VTAAALLASPRPDLDPVQVDPAHEARQMAEVQERLEARFPDLDPSVVAAAVQVAAAGITGPVREYVPLLVERAARERLNRAVAGGGTAPVARGSRDLTAQ